MSICQCYVFVRRPLDCRQPDGAGDLMAPVEPGIELHENEPRPGRFGQGKPGALQSEGRVSPVAVPHRADVIGDAWTIADSDRANVRFCIGWVWRLRQRAWASVGQLR